MKEKLDNTSLCVAFVGHTHIENLASLKKQVEQLPEFRIIFFKTSSNKLWIFEKGELNYEIKKK